jgi:hypothetical protein
MNTDSGELGKAKGIQPNRKSEREKNNGVFPTANEFWV